MASSVLQGEDFHQILRRHKKRLTAEINYDDVEDLLIVHGFVSQDYYCSVGELIAAMTSHGNHCWPVHRCIQVFKVIKEHTKYVSCTYINSVIDELEQAESSGSNPEQVESSESEAEQLCLKRNGLDGLISPLDPEFENLFEKSMCSIAESNAQSNQVEKCVFNIYTKDGEYVVKTLPIILKKYLPQIVERCSMYLQVVCAGCIEMLKRFDIDEPRFQLSTQAKEINEVFKGLRKQVAPINVTKVIKEDLLPRMKCIGSVVTKITSPPPKSWHEVIFTWKTLCFKLIDTDNLKMLCYYQRALEYLIDIVAFLTTIDTRSQAPMTGSSLKGMQISWEKCRKNIIEAKEFYENGNAAKQARMRGWAATVGYTAVALGIFLTPYGGILALSAAGAIILSGGIYTESCIKALPDTIKSCEKEIGKEMDQTLDKIPAKELKKFCTDVTD